MKLSKDDHRVKYTKMVLTEALINLLKETPLEKISISELSRTSGITRATFYAHYDGIYELLSEIQTNFIESMLRDFRKMIDSTASHEQVVPEMMQKIKDHQDLCKMSITNENFTLMAKMVDSVKTELSNEWTKRYGVTDLFIVQQGAEYIISGCMGLIETWILSNCKDSPEQMATSLIDMTTKLIDGFVRSQHK
jgi:AcrR family transcriptional regulator